jgi:exopolysaccharide biosynthesis polyprenyl glycosylphosphotransferase
VTWDATRGLAGAGKPRSSLVSPAPNPGPGTAPPPGPAPNPGPNPAPTPVAARSAGPLWEQRYVRRLLVGDAGAVAGVGGVALGAGVADPDRAGVLLALVLPVAFVGALALSRSYERRFLFVGGEEYRRVLRGGTGLLAADALASYPPGGRLGRGDMPVLLALATLACLAVRWYLRCRLRRARGRGACLRRVIMVGHEPTVITLAARLRRERYHGLQVVGYCLPAGGHGDLDLPVYGSFDEVAAAVRGARVDTVIVLPCPELDGAALRRLGWHLERDGADLILASSLVDVAGARTSIRPVDGLPLLHVERARLTGAARMLKAVFDRLAGAVLLLLTVPLMLVVAAAVKYRSTGPVLFRQVRVGKDGREFVMYKFRTMHTDAESRLAEIRHLNEYDGVLFKMRDDPRVTPVGRWLRRFSLDELPQVVNVLLGHMSLVGPRPPLPEEVARYADDVRRRLAVKPGLTGPWQVSGRSDLSWEETVRLDLAYVENWSLTLDLVILLRTVTAVCRASGAY